MAQMGPWLIHTTRFPSRRLTSWFTGQLHFTLKDIYHHNIFACSRCYFQNYKLYLCYYRSLCSDENASYCADPALYPVETAKLALENVKGKHHLLQMFNTRPEEVQEKEETDEAETKTLLNFTTSAMDGGGDAFGLMTRHGISSLDRARPSQLASLASGLGPSPEMTKVCPSDIKFITPKRALNKHKVRKWIAQVSLEKWNAVT